MNSGNLGLFAPKVAAERGMSLAEVMVALGILAFVATGIMAVTLQIRSMAEQTVYQNTSLVLAQGYVEQLRSLDYTTLDAAARDSSGTVELPLLNAAGAAPADASGGVLGNGDWSSERIFLDEDASGNPIQPLQFEFRPVLTSLDVATSGTALGVEISLEYRTTYNFGSRRTFGGTLRTVRSAIPTY